MTRVAILLSLFMAANVSFASEVSKNRKGNKAFKEKRYEEAARHYHEAEIEAPERRELSYNLANALFRNNDFEGAAKAYEKARSIKNPKLRKQAVFNAGNNAFRAGSAEQAQDGKKKLEEAVKMYKEVLKMDPSDMPAKYNLQKTLERIQQMEQQQQQNQDSDKDKKDKDKKEQEKKQDNKRQNDKDKDKDGDKNKDKQNQEENQDEQKPDDKQRQSEKKEGEMSEEEAKRLLDALKQDEKDLQKKLMRMKVPTRKMEKDW